MFKKALFLVLTLTSFLILPSKIAQASSFVTVVNPIRGSEFWDLKDQKPEDSVREQMTINQKLKIPTTWLLRYDAMDDTPLTTLVKSRSGSDEAGLFLEVTPKWSSAAGVAYHQSPTWHMAGSVFLTGYSQEDRKKLIDTAFAKFKLQFGIYPKSVGAWWIDAYSLEYMQQKYGVVAALIVADQYSTDNYQIWGQYWEAPYYPSRVNTLFPAADKNSKLPVVVTQWAARDPLNGYGKGVEDSTYSIQANDYLDYHKLNTDYFSKLVDIYTKQPQNRVNQLVVGLENSYSLQKYQDEYRRQMETLSSKSKTGQFSLVTMEHFASWYQDNFPGVSPSQLIVADDPLGSGSKTVWFMNTFYRVGWIYQNTETASNSSGSLIRDIRQYVLGQEEICYSKSCDQVNFATYTTRVLDEVTYNRKWQIDLGKITEFKSTPSEAKTVLGYKNAVGEDRTIEFLPRDISVNGKTYSVDTAILNSLSQSTPVNRAGPKYSDGISLSLGNVASSFVDLIKFLLLILLAFIVPGWLFLKKFSSFLFTTLQKVFLSLTLGLVIFTAVSLVAGYFKVWFISDLYMALALIIFLKFSVRKLRLPIIKFDKWSMVFTLVIVGGTIFQVIPVFKSTLIYNYGMGFWGPNAHDGSWHIALVNQILNGLPPSNPILSGETLFNYHYFYDLLIASTSAAFGLKVPDLIFRLYPVLFSLLVGIGAYSLFHHLFKNRLNKKDFNVALAFSLYLIYFCGSFGWVVEFIRERHWNGESAFWANQTPSFNLNPPFAISLILVIALFHFVNSAGSKQRGKAIAILLLAFLVGFKAYGAILAMLTLGLVSLTALVFWRNWEFLKTFLGALILTLLLVSPIYNLGNLIKNSGAGLFIWSPFWLIHTMIDSPDRVGWTRLTLGRVNSLASGQWLKFILVEIIGLAIFVIGNLGVRILSFGMLGKISEIRKDPLFFYIFIFSLFSLVIPLVFIQTGNPWNTIQFLYYDLFISAFLSGVVFSRLRIVLIKPLYFLLILFVLITPINAIAVVKGYLANTPHTFISTKELEALNFLASQPNGFVLAYPYSKEFRDQFSEPLPLFAYETTAYVSAFSKKPTFVSDEIQNDVLGTNYKERIIQSTYFFTGQDSLDFLNKNNIRYIYIDKKLYPSLLSAEKLHLKSIFDNSEVLIYQVLD